MVNISERIGQVVDAAAMGFIDAGVAVQENLAPVGNWVVEGRNYAVRLLTFLARAMHDVYSLDGFEKWSKVVGADLKFLNILPCCKGIFDDAIRAAEDQKNLYYATLFIGSMCDFIKRRKTVRIVFKCQRLKKEMLMANL